MLDAIQLALVSWKMWNKHINDLLNLSTAIEYCEKDLCTTIRYIYIMDFLDWELEKDQDLPSIETICTHIKFSEESNDKTKDIIKNYFMLDWLEAKLKSILKIISTPNIWISTITVEKK